VVQHVADRALRLGGVDPESPSSGGTFPTFGPELLMSGRTTPSPPIF
jgi:hypothetical protein